MAHLPGTSLRNSRPVATPAPGESGRGLLKELWQLRTALGPREQPPDSAPPDRVPAGGGPLHGFPLSPQRTAALETHSLGGGRVLNEADGGAVPDGSSVIRQAASGRKPASGPQACSCLPRGEAGGGRPLSLTRKTARVWRRVITSVGARECQ